MFGLGKSKKETTKEVKTEKKKKKNIFDEIDEAGSGEEMTKEEREKAKKLAAEYLG